MYPAVTLGLFKEPNPPLEVLGESAHQTLLRKRLPQDVNFFTFTLEQAGYLFGGEFAVGGIVLGIALKRLGFVSRQEGFAQTIAHAFSLAGFAMAIALALAYVFFPGFIDSYEASVATLGAVFRSGGQIYPEITDPTMGGLQYGPALAEIQALVQSLPLPIISASKIPGVASFVAFAWLMFHLLRSRLARAYLVFLLPFGAFLFWNRAEPILLLCVALSLLVLERQPAVTAVFLVGLLAGLASCLKAHAGLYVAATLIATGMLAKMTWRMTLSFVFGASFVAFMAYLPRQISLDRFIQYLVLAAHHGLSGTMLTENLAYVAVLLFPIFYVGIGASRLGRQVIREIVFLATLEFVVALIGAKPGAGAYHFIPFIPANAFLLQRLVRGADAPPSRSYVPIVFSLLALLVLPIPLTQWNLARSMMNDFAENHAAQTEMEALAKRFPTLVLGVTDQPRYAMVYFRPMLESRTARQIDYASYMDHEFSGLSDDVLVKALEACTFNPIAMPKRGEPFTLQSFYTQRPLFSDALRSAFQRQYGLVESGGYYSIFECVDKKH